MTRISTIEVMESIPFTPPYLMIDRAEISDCGTKVTSVKAYSANEEFFCGHFPEHAILPGVLQVHAMEQTALLACDCRGRTPFVSSAKRIKFRRPVFPGDILTVTVDITDKSDDQISIKANAKVGDRVTSQAMLTIDLIEDDSFFAPGGEMIPTPVYDVDTVVMNIEKIRSIIPHLYPFQLADRIIVNDRNDEDQLRIVGVKNVTFNEPYFAAMKVNSPFVPSHLLMEVVAQIGCISKLSEPGNENKLGFYLGVDKAIFHKPIVPGDCIVAEVVEEAFKMNFGKCTSKIFVGNEVRAEVDFKFALQEKEA